MPLSVLKKPKSVNGSSFFIFYHIIRIIYFNIPFTKQKRMNHRVALDYIFKMGSNFPFSLCTNVFSVAGVFPVSF